MAEFNYIRVIQPEQVWCLIHDHELRKCQHISLLHCITESFSAIHDSLKVTPLLWADPRHFQDPSPSHHHAILLTLHATLTDSLYFLLAMESNLNGSNSRCETKLQPPCITWSWYLISLTLTHGPLTLLISINIPRPGPPDIHRHGPGSSYTIIPIFTFLRCFSRHSRCQTCFIENRIYGQK